MKDTACIQLELSATGKRIAISAARGHQRSRAKWWFGKMREVVNLALPVNRINKPRPEQTYLTLRQTSLL